MKFVVFLTHWSIAFIEEQFYALYRRLAIPDPQRFIYFAEWHNSAAVDHLLSMFEPRNTTYDKSFYPPTTTNSPVHQLMQCNCDNTLFVIYFNPRHLAFFLRSTFNRFPRHYVWWQ